MKRIYLFLLVPVALLLTIGCNQDYENAAKPVTTPSPAPSDDKPDVVVKPDVVKGLSVDSKELPATETGAKKLDAENVLKQAVADAKEQNKVVFVHLGAPW